jgi:hypothetical protein
MHVAIVAHGNSMLDFMRLTADGPAPGVDEVWGINATGEVIACDRIFHMDDVRVQERRAEAKPKGPIARMLQWMRTATVPIVTSRPHPDYPATEAFPLEQVLNEVGRGYFNSTLAYAVAYAILRRVHKISLYGCDFSYENAHHAEKGRACVEYWLGIASARGIEVYVTPSSPLMDASTPASHLYGYDTLDVAIAREAGRWRVKTTPRAEFVSAEEIERRYDHSIRR